jgi:hypothetical protein
MFYVWYKELERASQKKGPKYIEVVVDPKIGNVT